MLDEAIPVPSGILSPWWFLVKIYSPRDRIELANKIIPNELDPKTPPTAPSNKKSPEPMPSNPFNFL